MQPKVGNRHFHAFSFYYDRAIDMGLMKGEDSVLKPGDFKSEAEKVCNITYKQHETKTPRKLKEKFWNFSVECLFGI